MLRRIPLVRCLAFAILLSVAIGQLGRSEEPSINAMVAGALADGTPVMQFTLRNARGSQLKVVELGATITELSLPDAKGQFANVILGSSNLEDYMRGFPAASVIGRYANRIRGAAFPLNGQTISVTKNSGANHIHGGKSNFAKVVWKGTSNVHLGAPQVTLTYQSADGEEGFPGNLQCKVTYSLLSNDTLAIDYRATTDKPTVVNLTNHAYFNLAGKGDVLNHSLQIDAENYTEVDRSLIPTGVIASVVNSPLDFRSPHNIGERIEALYDATRGYDHNYVLDGPPDQLKRAARVIEPESRRALECWTTEPGLQLYTANGFNGSPFVKHAAFCLETQHYPDSPNRPEFPSTTLRPNEVFQSRTEFRFSIAN